jgi:hypothetical protein
MFRVFYALASIEGRQVLVALFVRPNAKGGLSLYTVRGWDVVEGEEGSPAGPAGAAGSTGSPRSPAAQSDTALSGTGAPAGMTVGEAAELRKRRGPLFVLGDTAQPLDGQPPVRRLAGVAEVVAELERQFGAAVTALRDSGRLNMVASAADLPLDAQGRPAELMALGFYDPGVRTRGREWRHRRPRSACPACRPRRRGWSCVGACAFGVAGANGSYGRPSGSFWRRSSRSSTVVARMGC